MTDLEKILLETLSFYSPMTLEHILLDMDGEKISQHKDLHLEDLKTALKSLEKRKLLQTEGHDKAQTWIRVMPKKPWYKKMFKLFS